MAGSTRIASISRSRLPGGDGLSIARAFVIVVGPVRLALRSANEIDARLADVGAVLVRQEAPLGLGPVVDRFAFRRVETELLALGDRDITCATHIVAPDRLVWVVSERVIGGAILGLHCGFAALRAAWRACRNDRLRDRAGFKLAFAMIERVQPPDQLIIG